MGCILLSCNVSRHASPTPSPASNAGNSPRILFLNFEISRDTINATYTARLINAAEAIEEGAPSQNQITVTTRLVDDNLVISVQDTGSGIPEEVQRQMRWLRQINMV